jgi:predicted flap endonuclease-1-like 5' DNA nuclease
MRGTITNDQFDAEFLKVTDVADRARNLALQKIERIRQFAGAAAVREIARVRARDGANAATTVAAASNLLVEARTFTRLREELKAVSLGGRLKQDSTIAAGQIVSRGRPAVGVRVGITTDTGKPVAEAVTDEAGLFVVERDRAEFERITAGAAALVIVLRDAAGRTVDKRTTPIRQRGAVVLTIDLSTVRPTPPERSVSAREGLSGIHGLGQARLAKLAAAGITSVADLARMKRDELAETLGINAAAAADILKQAKARDSDG